MSDKHKALLRKHKELIAEVSQWLADYLAAGRLIAISAEQKEKISQAFVEMLEDFVKKHPKSLIGIGGGELDQTPGVLREKCGFDAARNFPDNFTAVVNFSRGIFRVRQDGKTRQVFPSVKIAQEPRAK